MKVIMFIFIASNGERKRNPDISGGGSENVTTFFTFLTVLHFLKGKLEQLDL